MRFIDLIQLVFYNLGRRKGRVLLTAIGVVIGTAAVVVLVSLAVGLQKNATQQLWGINDLTSIEVYPGFNMEASGMSSMSVKVGGGGGEGDDGMTYLTPAAIEEIAALPGVKLIVKEDYLNANMEMAFGKLRGYAGIMGVDIEDLAEMGLSASEGTTELVRGTAVIGSWINQNFYDPNARPTDPPVEPPQLLGETLRFILIKYTEDGQEVRKTYNIKVTGVLAETRGQADGTIYMGIDEVTTWNEWARGTRINRNKEGYAMLIVKAENPDVVIELADQINALGFMANTPQAVVEGINSFFTVLQIVFGGVGAIALLVAAIGIANTMTMSILERTREIGLMKAVGATNQDVLSIFLGEAAGIGFIGGLGGVLLGWGSSAVLNLIALSYFASQVSEQGGMPPTMVTTTPLWLPIFGLVFATLVGLVSGLYPALRAATMVPVNALKYE
jgi:putative ABC transport system permease protein